MKLLFHERLHETVESLYSMTIDELLDLDEEVRIREDVITVYKAELKRKEDKKTS